MANVKGSMVVETVYSDFPICTTTWTGILGGLTPPFPNIKKVIFNDPYTIVIWENDTKTIVKCGPDDRFSEDIGLAMAVVKKLYGGRCRYQKLLDSKAEYQLPKEVKVKKRTLKTK